MEGVWCYAAEVERQEHLAQDRIYVAFLSVLDLASTFRGDVRRLTVP